MKAEVKIQTSNGRTRGNATIIKWVRPAGDCINKSRKVSGFTGAEVSEKINNIIEKWYSPIIIFYQVEGVTIGSNSKKNALKEYWRICDLKDVGKQFEVSVIQFI